MRCADTGTAVLDRFAVIQCQLPDAKIEMFDEVQQAEIENHLATLKTVAGMAMMRLTKRLRTPPNNAPPFPA